MAQIDASKQVKLLPRRYADAMGANPWAWPAPDQFHLHRYNVGGDPNAWEEYVDNGLPALEFDFTGGTLLDTTGTYSLPLTRSTAGNYQNAAGAVASAAIDTARFEFRNGVCLGLLVEEAGGNLLLNTEDAGNAYWQKVGSSITANAIAAPDGTMTADKIVEDATNAQHGFRRNSIAAISANTWYTQQCFFKAAERTRADLFMQTSASFGADCRAIFDLSAGSVVALGTTPAGAILADIVPYASGWYLCSLSAQSQTGATGVLPTFRMANGLVASYAGDGVSGLYAWGMQYLQGASPQSYFPSAGVLANRGADLSSVLLSALAAEVLLTDTILVVVEFYPRHRGNVDRYAASLSDGTANNRAGIHTGAGQRIIGEVVTGGVAQAAIDGGGYTRDSLTKAAMLIRAADHGLSVGGAVLVPGAGSKPTVDRLHLAQGVAGGQLNGVVKRLRIFNARRTNPSIALLAA